MLRLVGITALLGLALQSAGSVPARVRVTPVYSKDLTSPAFLVECLNDSQQPRSIIGYVSRMASIQIDGVVQERGVAGSLIGRPGEPPEVPAGETFRQLMVLGDSPQGPVTFPQSLGQVLVGAQGLSALSGEHIVAFMCWEKWSDDVRFVWLR